MMAYRDNLKILYRKKGFLYLYHPYLVCFKAGSAGYKPYKVFPKDEMSGT
jgi:hypothetical protein